MMKRTGDDTSGSVWPSVVARLDAYVESVNRNGTIDPAGKVFIALAGSQAARSIGCSLRELCILTSLKKSEVKYGLSWLMSYGLVKMGPTRFALPATLGSNRIHYPSKWVKGQTLERRSGPRVPLYELQFDKELVIEAIGRIATLNVDEFFDRLDAEVRSKPSAHWKEYRAFTRILMHDLAVILANVMHTYEEYMPLEVKLTFRRLLDAVPTVAVDLRQKGRALDLLDRMRTYVQKPLALSF